MKCGNDTMSTSFKSYNKYRESKLLIKRVSWLVVALISKDVHDIIREQVTDTVLLEKSNKLCKFYCKIALLCEYRCMLTVTCTTLSASALNNLWNCLQLCTMFRESPNTCKYMSILDILDSSCTAIYKPSHTQRERERDVNWHCLWGESLYNNQSERLLLATISAL